MDGKDMCEGRALYGYFSKKLVWCIWLKCKNKSQILAKSLEMQRLFLAPTCTSLCTQEGSKHAKVLSF